MVKLLLVATFGGLGSVLRYLVSGWAHGRSGGSFPAGTLVVNLLGCLGIGLAGAYFVGPRQVRDEYRIAVMVGLLGGFTTFSSYAWESIRLVDGGEVAAALANVLLSNALGLLVAGLAYRVGIRIFGA